jgi:hypothetical protein
MGKTEPKKRRKLLATGYELGARNCRSLYPDL